MCYRPLFFALLSIILTSCQTDLGSPPPHEPEENRQVPNDWLFRQRAYPSGELDLAAYRKAANQYQAQRQDQLLQKDLSTTPWQFDGPTNVGGRVTDIEVIPGTPETVLVGAASGGIFRTTDGGQSWAATFDDQPTLAIGDLALAPSNPQIVYAGTGEPNAGGGSLAYDGLGIYRSADGGQTWEAKGLPTVGSVGRVAVDPTDENRVYVAAMGTLFANNSERGIYRSTNGGEDWEQVLFLSDSTGGIDLAIHPSAPLTIFAAMWERVRRPNRRSYNGPTSGIYRSTDGGDTWQELTNGLPTDPFFKGRISITIAPSDPNRMYAGYVAETGDLAKMMQSNDGGDTWLEMSINNLGTVPFDWWFNRLVVAGDDPDRLYYIGFNLNRYFPTSASWSLTFNGVHVDQHTLWIDPTDSDRMLLGNDGGVYYSEDGGTTFAKWNNLPITQFYTSEVDFQNPTRRYGGTQDNGTNRTLTGSTDDWNRIYFGDGFRVLVDPVDNQYVYASFQRGNIARSTNGGGSFSAAIDGLEESRRNWYTPYVLDPANPEHLYLGAERVYRSVDRAASWQAISPDLTNGDQSSSGITYGTITSLSVSPLSSDVIWVGTDDGNVWYTTDGGNDWQSVSTDLPNRWVTSITADPNDLDGAYLTFSGFRFGENIGHVYRTTNLGGFWQNYNGDLPDIPVNDLIVHPNNGTLFLATDLGVYYTDNDGVNWRPLGTGLPPVVVSDLTHHLPTETLVAGTYGRSMWSINVDTEVNLRAVNTLNIDWRIAPNPVREQAEIILKLPRAGQYTLALFDLQGRLLHTLHRGYFPKGEQRISWSAGNLAAGNYVCRLWQGHDHSSRRVVVQ
ncbi:MAG: T9SS type A sorting domain-containing protein [Bacteroidota bacterium]